MVDSNRLWRGAVNEIAPCVWYLPVIMANVYFIGEKNGPWVLVDAGVRGGAWRIRQAAMEIFGQAPMCILLTHGHFDHVGALPRLRRRVERARVCAHARDTIPEWNIGLSPPDPTARRVSWHRCRVCFRTAGWILAYTSAHCPKEAWLPGLPDWKWVRTPGHTSGHVSLFREDASDASSPAMQ